jgi:hypothetical protein
VARDALPPEAGTPRLLLVNASGAYLTGTLLYLGPSPAGSLDVSLTPTDTQAGVGSVSFPALFGSDTFVDTAAPYARAYPLDASQGSASVTLDVTDRVGNAAQSAPFTLVEDETAPAVTLSVAAGLGLRYNLTWSAVDGQSGISSYDVEYRVGAGNWTPWLVNTTDTAAEFILPPGQPIAFRVAAVDRVGNRGLSAEAGPFGSELQSVKYYTLNG